MKLIIDIPQGMIDAFSHEEQWTAVICRDMNTVLQKGTPYKERPKGKWVKQADCEGKAISYKCDACGFSEGWCDYKWCPMCGDIKETQPEDDEDGTEIDWPEDLKVLCIRFECIHSDGTGRCKIQDEFDIHGLSCGRYKRR